MNQLSRQTKTILVTGSNGQLGRELLEISGRFPKLNFLFTDVAELDITKQAEIKKFLAENPVDLLINCAAYTAVDKAESEAEAAHLLNTVAPGLLAAEAASQGFAMIHISTDYVFSGQSYKPYTEADDPDPVSGYGKSKLGGEQAVLNSGANAMVIRTSWLYSAFGHNFLKTILRFGKEKPELKVVFDQIGTPTYAGDLAKCILDIISSHSIPKASVYHYSNEGVCSWYDFARAIAEYESLPCKIMPIRTSEYPTPAPRPAYSVLDKCKIKNDFGIEIPWWKDSIHHCLERLHAKNNVSS